jgi:hypothetical protein
VQFIKFILDVAYRLCNLKRLSGYKVEDKLLVGVREQTRLNTAGLDCDTAIADVLFVSLNEIRYKVPTHTVTHSLVQTRR